MYNQNKFKKLEKRLAKGINGGSFFQLAKEKQAQLARRIQRYANSLKQAVKPAILSAFLALGLSNAAQAQITFVERTGGSNPLDSITGGGYIQPAFVDIDNDGDMDLFTGSGSSQLRYFQNTGNQTSPNFVQRTGSSNPFSIALGSYIFTLDFADMDNDGDKDAIVGVGAYFLEPIDYYQNIGSASAPTFSEDTSAASPVNGITLSTFARDRPTLVDIDNDSDFDLFISKRDGTISFYRNTGTAAIPTFTAQTGTNNPFNSYSTGGYASISFVDLDNDGDFDAVIGEEYGTLLYFLNTGTSSSPIFSNQSGSLNPFDGIDVGERSTPDFVDIDGDGDMDLFVGEMPNGKVKYFENTTVVGTQFISKSEVVNLFPNPTQGQLYFTEPLEGKLEVYNLMGQLVMEQNLQNTASIDISPLENGTYILKLNSDKEVFVDKIRLER